MIEVRLILPIMDPKTPSSLDPKLKEVYDRVMNTKVTPSQPATHEPSYGSPTLPPQQQSTVTVSTPTTTTQVTPQPALASTSGAPKSAVDYAGLANHYAAPTPQPTKPAVVTPSGTTYGVVNTNGNTKVDIKVSDKKGSGSKTILIALGILVFFLIYTVVWFFFFGLELPFLSS